MTRLWALSLYLVLSPSQLHQILTDSYHHYQVGILLILLAYPLKKIFNPLVMLTIGGGIALEELSVILRELGIRHVIHYQSGLDIFIIITMIGIVYILSCISRRN